jgi:hypothetical protein
MRTGRQERARMMWYSFEGSRPIRLGLLVPLNEEEGVSSHVRCRWRRRSLLHPGLEG